MRSVRTNKHKFKPNVTSPSHHKPPPVSSVTMFSLFVGRVANARAVPALAAARTPTSTSTLQAFTARRTFLTTVPLREPTKAKQTTTKPTAAKSKTTTKAATTKAATTKKANATEKVAPKKAAPKKKVAAKQPAKAKKPKKVAPPSTSYVPFRISRPWVLSTSLR